ncbi:type 2 lantipeptide synthetase LanM [Bacillus sp. WMMC1349]|uniref:type 2 lanthipeptide synthetase LanM family protein n=1 Tax=Bacillus sp. WMMC1349 TaxID=2736254 RepID=UPI00155527F9|nr:type 2 lanthipeptide synthetase LanM family protein [Bacillus sp. WMMC1349]NPC93161.1 type 2 lantipeptide synthetase LanM [Bacillus sp. WMMC1349]
MINITNLSKSLTIKERYKVHEKLNESINGNSLQLWRTDMSIISEQTFEKMLSYNSYSKDIFSNAVNRSYNKEINQLYEESVKKQEWYKLFHKSIHQFTYDNSNENEEKSPQYLLRPFINYSKNKIESFINDNQYDVIFKNHFVDNLVKQLGSFLIDIAHKCIVLELNLQRENNELKGDSSTERFQYFLEQYSNTGKLIEFYNEYIVMTRLLSTTTLFFIENTQTIIDKLYKDKKSIIDKYGIKNYEVSEIIFGEGDTHQKGKTVAKINFSSSQTIFYKPKPLSINIAFKRFIDWLNLQKNIKDMKVPDSLIFDSYTFESYIEYKPCNSIEEVKDYYVRFGQLMGVIFLLNGTDIHMENLISHGEYPVIIDLETLIQQPLQIKNNKNGSLNEINNTIFHHVTRTMFLPTIGLKTDSPVNIDLSALNGKSEKVKVLQPVNVNSDEMRYDYTEYTTDGANNLPFMENCEIDYKKYKEEIIKGFKNVFEIILKNKKKLTEENGIINEFHNISVRCLFRDTSQYANILFHTLHPEFLTDMLDREKALENMWGYPFEDKHLILSEVKDMLNNDIPIFFNNTCSTDLIDSENNRISKFFTSTSFDYFKKYIQNIDEQEIKKQISIIYMFFGDFTDYKKNIINEKMYKTNLKIKYIQPLNLDYLSEAKNIGDEIINRAVIKEDISWIVPYNISDNNWSLIPIRQDFYGGLGGLYLFFYYLYKETNDKKYFDFSNRLLDQCYVEDLYDNKQVGLTGFPGFLYSFSIMKDCEENVLEINKLVKEYCKLLDNEIENNVQVDYLNGVTGLINILLKFYNRNKNLHFIELAIKYTEYLTQRLNEVSNLGNGFSHGAIGYALVLLKMWKVTNVNKYLIKARELLLYEDKNFDDNILKNRWCNGITGIGLAMIDIENIGIEFPKNKLNIDSIYNKIISSHLLNNDTICHGNMGIIDFLLSKYKKDNDNSLGVAKAIADQVIMAKSKNGEFKLIDTDNYRDISLFTGLAGIAYQLLRVNNPEKVPSVLSI